MKAKLKICIVMALLVVGATSAIRANAGIEAIEFRYYDVVYESIFDPGTRVQVGGRFLGCGGSVSSWGRVTEDVEGDPYPCYSF